MRKFRRKVQVEFPPAAPGGTASGRLSQALRDALRASDQSMYQIALAAGVSQIVVSRFVSGERRHPHGHGGQAGRGTRLANREGIVTHGPCKRNPSEVGLYRGSKTPRGCHVAQGSQPGSQGQQEPPGKNGSSAFTDLVALWKRERGLHSSSARLAEHPAYQEIIGMGPEVIPLLLRELEREPDHWFRALHALTGANPVPVESRGKVPEMAAALARLGPAHRGFSGKLAVNKIGVASTVLLAEAEGRSLKAGDQVTAVIRPTE